MSGIAALLSGGVNGYFEGVDWRDNKKRQAQLDKYRADAEARASERFGWEQADRARADKERSDYQQAISDWLDGTGGQDGTAEAPGVRPAAATGGSATPLPHPVSVARAPQPTEAVPLPHPGQARDRLPPPQTDPSLPQDPRVAGVRPTALPHPGQMPADDSARQQLGAFFQSQTAGPPQAAGAPGYAPIAPGTDLPQQRWPDPQAPHSVMPRPLDPDARMSDFEKRSRIDAQANWDFNFADRYRPDGLPIDYAAQPTVDTRAPQRPPEAIAAEDAAQLPGPAGVRPGRAVPQEPPRVTPDTRILPQSLPHPGQQRGAEAAPAPRPAPGITTVDPTRSAIVQDVQGMMRRGDVASAINQIAEGVATGRYGKPGGSIASRALGSVTDYLTATPEQGAANKKERAKAAEVGDWFRSEEAAKTFQGDPSQLEAAAADPFAYYEKRKQVAAAEPLGVRTPTKPSKDEAAALAASTRSVLSDTQAPSAEVVQATVGVLGASKTEKLSEDQVTRAVEAGTQHYRTDAAQKVMRVLLEQGQLDKAIQFQGWLDQKSTKAGMEKWMRATVAASVGDFDTFADNIVEAYNSQDYFGDDMSIDKANSGFTKDENGSIAGAKITFRNESTGATFEQIYDSPDDLVRMGINMLSPENAFEWHLKQMEAAQSLGAERAKKEGDDTEKRRKQILDVQKQLSDEDPTFGSLPEEEKQKRISQRLQMIEGMTTGTTPQAGPPVAYRPGS